MTILSHPILTFFSFFSVETERGKNGRNVILPKIDNGRNHEVLARKEARSRGHGGHSHVSRKKRHGHVPQVRYLGDSLFGGRYNYKSIFSRNLSLDNTELSVFWVSKVSFKSLKVGRPKVEAMEATRTSLAKRDMAMYLRWDIWEILSLEEDIIINRYFQEIFPLTTPSFLFFESVKFPLKA